MLSKEKILEKIQEEDLIRHLVPTFKGNLRKKNYKSIFSDKDDKPSMSIYKEDGRWKFKSHNTGHNGDVFALWGHYYGLDCRTNFKEILEKINQEMLLGLDTKEAIIAPVTAPITPTSTKHHSISFTPFSSLFLAYWDQFGITKDILDRFNVKQVAKISFISNSGRPLTFHYETQGKLVASYDIDSRIKLYVPSIPAHFCSDIFFKEQKKAFGYKNQTKSDVFGLSQLPEGDLDYILFTAGEKDCMSACARGFHAISLQSENQFPEESLLQMLRCKTTVLLSCYDNDKAGLNASKRLLDAFGITAIGLPQHVKDLAEYFQQYTAEDFNALLLSAVEKSEPIQLTSPITKSASTDRGDTFIHEIESYLKSKYDFRFDTIGLKIEICSKTKSSLWEKLNDAELWRELNKNKIKVSRQNLQSILQSFFVPEYNPIKYYFLQFENKVLDGRDYIFELASYVFLEDGSEAAFQYWYTHLRKWMIRAVRSVFESRAINKHALILSSDKEGIGKSFFCEFLCPTSLLDYYNSNPTIDHDKDSQICLATNFIINLDELQQFKAGSSKLKSWLSQTSVKVRLPYEKTDTIKHRIASFLGSTNDVEFLRSGLGYSRWIGFRIQGTKRIDCPAKELLEMAWFQAYNYYKQDSGSGELTTKEYEVLQDKSEEFLVKSSESELIEKYLVQSTKEEGTFMTTTDILQYIQERIGTTIRLNKITLGKALNELCFKREIHRDGNKVFRGYWILACIS